MQGGNFGTLTFTPAADVFGEFVFRVVASDGQGNLNSNDRGDQSNSVPQTLTINVRPQNDAPRPNVSDAQLQAALTFAVTEDQPLANQPTSLLTNRFVVGPPNEQNGSAPGPAPMLSLQPLATQTARGGRIVSNPASGSTPASFTYIPPANFVGVDTLGFTIVDNGQSVGLAGPPAVDDPKSTTRTITFNVNPVNDAPQFIGGDDITVLEDESRAQFPVSGIDADPGSGSTSAPGVVTINDFITNIATGPGGSFDEANQSLTYDVVAVGGATVQFTTPPRIVPDGSGNGDLLFTLADDRFGTAAFDLTVRDNGPTGGDNANASPTRRFTINVNSVNDPPTFNAPAEVVVDEDSGRYNRVFATNLSAGPDNEVGQSIVGFRVDGLDPAEIALLDSLTPADQPPEYVRISNTGILTFRPKADAIGTIDLTISATDSAGAQSPGRPLRLTIVPVGDRPTAVNDDLTGINPGAASTTEDQILTITAAQLLGNDTDPDGDTLFLSMPRTQTSRLGAVVTFDPVAQTITYDPTGVAALNRLQVDSPVQTDSFVYGITDRAAAVTDGFVGSTATVTLTISGVDDAPVAVADRPVINETGSTTIDVLSNDRDPDGRPGAPNETGVPPLRSSIVITQAPDFGDLTIGPDGRITYTPFSGTTQLDSFRYRIADALGGSPSDPGVLVTIDPNTTATPFQNPDENFDVNNDGNVSALDALRIINVLNRFDNNLIPTQTLVDAGITPPGSTPTVPGTGNFYDVNGDGNVSSRDALRVIERLNLLANSMVGQSEPMAELRDTPVATIVFGRPESTPIAAQSTPAEVFAESDKWIAAADTIDPNSAIDQMLTEGEDDDVQILDSVLADLL